MKKILALLLAAALLLACLAACNGEETPSEESGENSASAQEDSAAATPAPTPTPKPDPVKIGILTPGDVGGWSQGVGYYAEARAKELAQEGDAEYQLISCADGEEFLAGLQELQSWGAQAMVVYPMFSGLDEALQAVIDEGTPVVSVDLVRACTGIYRVTGDNSGMGAAGAQAVADEIGDSGTVILLNVPSAGSVSEDRQRGFQEKLTELAPNMTVETFAARFNRAEAKQAFADVLMSHDHIDAVYAMDDDIALGVLDAMGEAARSDIKIVVAGGGRQDVLALMGESGTRLVCPSYSPAIAADAVDTALTLARGEEADAVLTVPTTLITPENAEQYLDENSPY